VADSDPTAIPEGVPAERVDQLYGLPLDEFTPARDALTKELRSGGNRDAATWVKGLRKPSAAAWLVNQLARTQRKDAEHLINAAEQLQEAQQRVLAGKSSSGELARAGVEQSEAIRGLMAKAPGMLDSRGHSPTDATLEKAEQTLRAVPLDERAREEFAAGRLTREHRATGFGLLDADGAAAAAVSAISAAPAKTKRESAPGPAKPKPDKAAQEKQRRAEQRAHAKQALKDARAVLAARRRAVSGAKSELSQARREAERAERKVRQAGEALERAEAAEAEAAERVAEAAHKASS
jgi:hypothetical protein